MRRIFCLMALLVFVLAGCRPAPVVAPVSVSTPEPTAPLTLLPSATIPQPSPPTATMPAATTAPAAGLPTQVELTELLARLVDEEKRATGMVIGMVSPEGRIVAGYGQYSASDPREPDGKTLFEIGSISKTFIALLLAEAIQEGDMAMDDLVQKYLPENVLAPEYGGRSITLLDLATHKSGLPRDLSIPEGRSDAEWVQVMYEFLTGFELTRKPGDKYEYSNLGMGLLSTALENQAGIPYEQLLVERALAPLGLTNTFLPPDGPPPANMAAGHNSLLYPVTDYEYTYPPNHAIGAIVSCADDMLSYLSVAAGLSPSPLSEDLRLAATLQREAFQTTGIGLSWFITLYDGGEIVSHAGHTHGMHAFIGFDRDRQLGVVVLANAAVVNDDVGMHLLAHQAYAIQPHTPRTLPTPAVVDAQTLQLYAGEYLLEGIKMTVTFDGEQLTALQEGDSIPLTLIPENTVTFHALEYNLSFLFLTSGGKVRRMIVTQNDQGKSYTFTPAEK